MRKLAIVTMSLAMLAFGAGTGTAQEVERRITVTGKGAVSARPTVVDARLGVETRGQSASAALDGNGRRMAAVVATARKAGVSDGDIRTGTLSVRRVFDETRSGGRSQGPRYAATNEVRVRLDGADGLGAFLDRAVSAGANRIGGLEFGFADGAALAEKARRRAMTAARRKATLLAGEADATLGDVLVIREGHPQGAPRPVEAMALGASSVPVEAGARKVTAAVTVTWALRP